MTTAMATRFKLHIPFPDFLQPRRGTRSLGQRANSQPEQGQSQSRQEPETKQKEQAIPAPEGEDEEESRRASIRAAHEFLLETIRSEDRWSAHMPLIRIDCPHTLAELHALGHLPRSEGIKECRKMVRVPVIHDEIGLFLWTRLAEMALALSFTDVNGGDDDDDDDEVTKGITAEKKDTRRRQQQRTEAFFAHLDQRFRFDRPASVPAKGKRSESPQVSPRQKQRSFTMKSSPSSSRRPSSNQAVVSQLCHFCRHDSIHARAEIPEEIRSEALKATAGRTRDRRGRQRPQVFSQNQTPPNATASFRQRSATFFNVSRNSSFVGSLIWQREQATRSSSGSRASSVTRPRSGSLAARLGSVVGGLGNSVGVALGGSLSHGYGGQQKRSASSRSV